MSSDLVEFVAARLAEDELAADAVIFACRDSRQPWPPEQAPGRGGPALTAYLKNFSENRVVREVQAKRIVLAEYAAVAKNEGHDDVEYADGWVAGLGMAVRAMAAAWNDHPDYRTDWTPRG